MDFYPNSEYEILTEDGFKDFVGITSQESKSTLLIETTNSSLKCTKNHKLYSVSHNDYIESQNLKVGNILRGENSNEEIVNITEIEEETRVCDILEVKDTNSFYADSLLVHNCLILDELAFVPANIAEDFFRSVYPTISKGSTTKIVIVSTPNGINLFYKLWQESVAGKNAYMPFTMHWSEVPGRDEKWKEETIKNIGEESFQQEFELSFFGSATNTLIASSKLRSLVFESPIHSERGLDIYEMPQKNHQYVLVADVGRGGGADYSAFTIIDFTDVPYKVVAKYKSNVIKALVFPNVIVEIAKKYNDAYLLIEANDVGSQVADIIRYEHEYENMFCSVLDKKMSMYTITLRANEKTKLGVMTSKKVKNVGCSCLKSLIESDTIIIKDFDIISELTNFVSKETSFGAQIGMNDDLVMTLVLFSWLTQQRFFKQLTDSNLLELLKNNEEKFSNIPFFSYSDGSSKLDSDSSAIDEGDLVLVSQQTWKHY